MKKNKFTITNLHKFKQMICHLLIKKINFIINNHNKIKNNSKKISINKQLIHNNNTNNHKYYNKICFCQPINKYKILLSHSKLK